MGRRRRRGISFLGRRSCYEKRSQGVMVFGEGMRLLLDPNASFMTTELEFYVF
jgi:hypothetical protein